MTNTFFRYNQRSLVACLVVALLVSCNKEISNQSTESVTDENALNATVSTRLLSNLLWADDLEGLLWFLNVSVQTSTSYGITRTTSNVFEGTKSARFELRSGDSETNGGTRAEISFQPATNLNRWYSFALFAPSAQFKWDDEDDCLIQFHQGNGETPALCLRVREDRIYIRILGVWNDLGAFEKDKWTSYVLHVKHSTGSTGLIELWRNGVKLMDRSGANMYKLEDYGDHNPSLKLGIYKSAWNGSSTTETSTRVIYYDDIKIGNEYATYEDMVPVPNNPPPASGGTSSTTGVSITGFKLVDAATEKDVMTITNGQTISLSALDLTKVNIRAITSSTEPGSVKFELSGEQSKTYTDSRAPFALHGDNGYGNFYYGNWYPPETGTYTLKATPYTSDYASGSAGTSQTITFTIVR
ncbi:polysaccharide lyase [Niastella sp. OAS944]|uniref:polysaccharide lyase n=1 Tax=Niastella sp. OAS944 TaxID=2664089 RepID=UPI0034962BD6|nr:hypothetical protein [Chitinophagaceae bacterium OAS944]